ncbi:MAG: class I SAM-dependent methyltransferase [Planctomycetota bacterium]|nr:class I SAM-dependent methyltransferase [Planctomycetota bacterium]
MTDPVTLYYDLTAESRAEQWYGNEILMPTIRQFIAFLPRRPRVLDLGCGCGYESMRLASAGAEVLGLDFSGASIRIARQRAPQCRFEQEDFRGLDDRHGMFDGVFAAGSIIHVAHAEWPDLAGRIARVLRPNGRLLAVVKDGAGTMVRTEEVAGRQIRREIHLYTREALAAATEALEYAGDAVLDRDLLDRGWRGYYFLHRDKR